MSAVLSAAGGVVVDASVAAKWHLDDEVLAEEARLLLAAYRGGSLRMAAPAFIRYEIAQTFDRARRAKRISRHVAEGELQSFMMLGIHAEKDSDDLVAAAQRIARETGATVYDALYVGYAQSLGLALVTDDRELGDEMQGHPARVHLLEDVRSLL